MPQDTAASSRRPVRPLASRLRDLHAMVAPVVVLPLLLTVSSGVSYRLLRDWGGFDRQASHVLMVLHEGEWLRRWLGPTGETLYVLCNGLGLLWMLATGASLAWQRLRRQQRLEQERGAP